MSELELEALPPVRKNVFKHSLSIVGLYIVVGIFMMVAVFLASGTTPKAIHVNYDSIAAANKMRDAFDALQNPILFPEKKPAEWVAQFEQNLQFEETNITEPGEKELVQLVRLNWTQSVNRFPLSAENYHRVRQELSGITQVNERGMFSWVEKSHAFSQQVFVVTVILFLLTILTALYFADALAVKIATPLRELSAALKQLPEPGNELLIPKPTTLEMRILSQALLQFWNRISYFQTLNLEQISAQRTKLEAVLTSVEDAVLVLDKSERIIHFNSGFEMALLLPATALFNQPWRDLPSASDNYLTLRAALHPNVQSDHPIELEIGGKKRTFSARHREIRDERKSAIGDLYLLHDITELKQRDFLRAEFIGVLSHELKTPLQSLGTASELLVHQKDNFSPDQRMLLETIFEDTGRIKNVVNEFIEVGISDIHSLRLKMEVVPIQKLLLQWMQPVRLIAKDKQVSVEAGLMLADEVLVKIDKIKFSWAVANLLSNALRISPPGGKITVSTQKIEGTIVIAVSDEGPGIPPEIQGRMFEPYFQAPAKDGVKTSGFLGIGLTITREVIEAHQGRIEYQANLPKGSIFKLVLPAMID